jgi:hypothetical protein
MTTLTTGRHPYLKPDLKPDLKMVNRDAAAIDIDATMHMAAVNPMACGLPVRAFGTFIQDLHAVADWFGMQRHQRGHGIDGRPLDPGVRDPGGPRLRRDPCECPPCQEGARTQNRRWRCRMAAPGGLSRGSFRPEA